MKRSGKRLAANAGALCAALWLGACATQGGAFVAPDDAGSLTARDLERVLRENVLAPGQNIKVVSLQRGAHSAHVLVQVRDREPVHYHADSDITVLMLRGTGTMHVGAQALATRAGDTVFIPRGVVHYFVNESTTPAAALVTYSPPPGPQDRVLVSPTR